MMTKSEFEIGKTFILCGKLWQCTDIGTRTVAAIKREHENDPSWYHGPPYAISERVIDENDMEVCYKTIEEYQKES